MKPVDSRRGIADGVYAWFEDHLISIGELLMAAVKESVYEAVYTWLDDNRAEVLRQIERADRDQQPPAAAQ